MRHKQFFCLFLVTVLLLSSLCMSLSSCQMEEGGSSDVQTLYVYNWGEYISDGSEGTDDVNQLFEQYYFEKYGKRVKVNYSTFSSNEDMYAKVSSGSASYDVIVPSDYMIQRMVKEDLLEPLNPYMHLIPNYANVSDAFKGENVYYEDDTKNIYSIPYFYGMIGIIYNTQKVDENDEQLGSWALMWDEDYKRDILQFNNSRDAFGTALYYLGYDVNNATDEQWREALELLKKQKPLLQGYVMDEIFNKMQGGSAAVAAYYAGDFLSMYENNEDLAFYYPQEGTNIYVDAMCVPKNARNKELAMEYINFMCADAVTIGDSEYNIGESNALYTYYASPLTTVVESESYQEEMGDEAMDILYGMAEDVEAQPYLNLDDDGLIRLNDLWEELKVESSVGVGIYIACGAIVAALVLLVVYLILKKRRWAKLYD